MFGDSRCVVIGLSEEGRPTRGAGEHQGADGPGSACGCGWGSARHRGWRRHSRPVCARHSCSQPSDQVVMGRDPSPDLEPDGCADRDLVCDGERTGIVVDGPSTRVTVISGSVATPWRSRRDRRGHVPAARRRLPTTGRRASRPRPPPEAVRTRVALPTRAPSDALPPSPSWAGRPTGCRGTPVPSPALWGRAALPPRHHELLTVQQQPVAPAMPGCADDATHHGDIRGVLLEGRKELVGIAGEWVGQQHQRARAPASPPGSSGPALPDGRAEPAPPDRRRRAGRGAPVARHDGQCRPHPIHARSPHRANMASPAWSSTSRPPASTPAALDPNSTVGDRSRRAAATMSSSAPW